ncbi:MAG: hypothetical protein HN867_19425 [Deltaproteobacteria bacterium]|nr:hypothetical protein [Deltaproteobacteria bacterium]
MTRQQVADAFGKPQSFVAKVEGYERRLDVIEYLEICKVVGVNGLDMLAVSIKT